MMVLRRGMTLTAMGIVLGVLGAIGLTRYVDGMLYQLTPLDPAISRRLPRPRRSCRHQTTSGIPNKTVPGAGIEPRRPSRDPGF
jgi:hypothetical protein